ncbi:hypothetical protein [Pontibacillus yanchengensis]|uniref:hypothetical protein n=1 Tax=Pontibacillus yanchengensis TaxID=462910 RepID=UPI000AE18D9A|nr:hypothetical protein [Pontibacillus yanchengensis]
MEISLDFIVLAAGIALAGYFIGNGLRNFGKQDYIDKLLDKSLEEDSSNKK